MMSKCFVNVLLYAVILLVLLLFNHMMIIFLTKLTLLQYLWCDEEKEIGSKS